MAAYAVTDEGVAADLEEVAESDIGLAGYPVRFTVTLSL